MTSVEPVRIADYLMYHAQQRGHSIALRLAGRNSSTTVDYRWSDLVDLVCRHLRWFDALPLPTALNMGDHLASWLPNGPQWIGLDLACQLRGYVHVALDRRLPPQSAWELAQHSSSRVLFVESDQCQTMSRLAEQTTAHQSHVSHHAHSACLVQTLPTFSELSPSASASKHASESSSENGSATWQLDELVELSSEVDPNWPAQLLYTSGTMSRPKGVVLTHRNLLTNAHGKLALAPQLPHDVRLNVLPFSHAYARTCELSTWLITGSQLCLAQDWESFLHHAVRIEPTLVNLVPHLAIKLSKEIGRGVAAQDLLGTRMRLLQVGGAALPREDWDRLAAVGWAPLQGYGLTETSPVVCSNRAGGQRPDCVGYPIPGVEIRIDEAQLLWTRGPHVMSGYWRDEASTRSVMRDDWFCTGDIAEFTNDGAVRILGRHDDLIALSTGYKVSPFEITSQLQSEEWIESLVVVGQNRPFIAALVVPCWQKLDGQYTSMSIHNASTLPPAEVTRLEQWMLHRINSRLAELPRWMQLGRVLVWDQPLSIDNGGINFKGAVRRRYVEEVLAQERVKIIYDT